ncbi:MAG TPA: kelch repeat-containing protein [Gaiellaceae bacterium]
MKGPLVRLLPLALLVAAAGCGGQAKRSAPPPPATTAPARTVSAKPVARHPVIPVHVVERTLGSLADPVQDAAAAPGPGGALLVGGLTPADVSTDAVQLLHGSVERRAATLPAALHDAAAVRLGGSVYLFGGGDGVRQLDGIQRVAPGAPRTVGQLPAPSSDQAGAAIGSTAYVVGGYTGSAWLDTIVAWRPGKPARVVARLPGALRYAAVASAAGRLVIAGGSTPAGTASRAVLVFDPATGKVRRIGSLPAPTTHAAAAAIGSRVYVIGGRGAAVDTPTAAVVAVDPGAGTVRPAGSLVAARSDLAAVSLGSRILLAGGRDANGTVATLSELVPGRAVASAVPKLLDRRDVYAADTPGGLRGPARQALPRVYVPNSQSDTVDVIDPRTYRIVGHFAVGGLPQHVVPSYDLRWLYVTNDTGNSLTQIDPRTAKPVRTIPVDDPYNMYFTPDGRYAIVVAERNARLDFRDAHTFALVHSVSVPCRGVDHMDFTADGAKALVSCEFSHQLLELDVVHERVVKVFTYPGVGMPQDVKLSPDGRVFYVADMDANGVWIVGAKSFRFVGFRHTGRGAHGLYPSRDARFLYVSNRGEGSVSVLDFATRKVVKTWRLPGGGSPDMGGVSADGKVLWLTGRYNAEIYAISTVTGKLLRRIPVGLGPHGACVWPQPGRYSLGHTGILR